MEKIWLKNYPPYVPTEINPDRYLSLADLFRESCQRYTKSPAFYNLGTTLSYQQLERYTEVVAAYLQQQLKLNPGDRIAIMLPNILQYPVFLFGALRAGLVIVNVNPLYTATELSYQLQDSGAKAIVVLAQFAHVVEQALATVMVPYVIVTHLEDLLTWPRAWLMKAIIKYVKKNIPPWHIANAISFKTILNQGSQFKYTEVELKPDDIALLQYTGGTTGVAKGAILSHRNLIANLEQAAAWIGPHLKLQQEIIITALPLYHIFSLLANCLLFVKLGGLNVLITNPRDITRLIKEIRRFPFTAITGVNSLFKAILHHQHCQQINFKPLKIALGGGAPIEKSIAEHWQTVTGVPLIEAYGLTETSPCVSINPLENKSFTGSIGLPVSSTEIALIGDDGRPVEVGQVGELAIKGPQVMQGYWQHPTETAHVFTQDGWLLTGDIATINNGGYLRIIERKKDLILVSGFNVYPHEVEEVIASLSGVLEVAVIGVPDDKTGEAVKAFIVKDKVCLQEKDILSCCAASLTAYKQPKYIQFCHELPKSPVGKVLKRLLR